MSKSPAHSAGETPSASGDTRSLSRTIEALRKIPKFKDLSDEELKGILDTLVIEERHEILSSHFSGPLPHPAAFAEYENVCPGAAKRILQMAEDNADHRHKINMMMAEADIKRSARGQILGFFLSLAFIIAALVCVWLKQPWPAGFLGVGGFSSIISLFVIGKRKNAK